MQDPKKCRGLQTAEVRYICWTGPAHQWVRNLRRLRRGEPSPLDVARSALIRARRADPDSYSRPSRARVGVASWGGLALAIRASPILAPFGRDVPTNRDSQSRKFSEMLAAAIRKYQNRAIETAKVIEELIALAKEMREEAARGTALKLTDDEVAFYDALEVNDSAVKVLGDETLRTIARELVSTVRQNTSIDWTVRENVSAHLRVLVRRILRKYAYPPDKQEKATQTVLQQAEVLSEGWATP